MRGICDITFSDFQLKKKMIDQRRARIEKIRGMIQKEKERRNHLLNILKNFEDHRNDTIAQINAILSPSLQNSSEYEEYDEAFDGEYSDDSDSDFYEAKESKKKTVSKKKSNANIKIPNKMPRVQPFPLVLPSNVGMNANSFNHMNNKDNVHIPMPSYNYQQIPMQYPYKEPISPPKLKPSYEKHANNILPSFISDCVKLIEKINFYQSGNIQIPNEILDLSVKLSHILNGKNYNQIFGKDTESLYNQFKSHMILLDMKINESRNKQILYGSPPEPLFSSKEAQMNFSLQIQNIENIITEFNAKLENVQELLFQQQYYEIPSIMNGVPLTSSDIQAYAQDKLQKENYLHQEICEIKKQIYNLTIQLNQLKEYEKNPVSNEIDNFDDS